MSIEVQILERFFASVNRNDMTTAARDLDPNVVRIEAEGFPTAGTYRGITAVVEHIAHGRGTWAEGSCDPERYLQNGQRVVVYLQVFVRLHGPSESIEGREHLRERDASLPRFVVDEFKAYLRCGRTCGRLSMASSG